MQLEISDRPGNSRDSDRHVTGRNRVYDDGVCTYAAIVADLDRADHFCTGADHDTVTDARRATADAEIAQSYAMV